MKKLGLALVAALLIGACSSETTRSTADDPGGSVTTATAFETTFPVTVTGSNGDVTLRHQPQAIVSLSPSATETLFEIDAGPQVVAVDEHSNHPAEAPVTDLSATTPDAAAIASHRPDLVVLDEDVDGVVASLENLEIPVLQLSGHDVHTLDDVYRQIEVLGAATGHPNEAADVVAEIQSGIEEALLAAPETQSPLTYYHELDPSHTTVTSLTLIGHLYAMFGLESIADGAGSEADSYGQLQLSDDDIIEANPDFIFLTNCCGESAPTVSDRPGWADLTAVRSGSIVVFDQEISSRPGPRVVEFVRGIAQAIEEKNPT